MKVHLFYVTLKKNPIDCKLCMLTITFHLGKPMRGFLVNTHCHDKNNYVQTARSLIAVNSLYTERCHYLIIRKRTDPQSS